MATRATIRSNGSIATIVSTRSTKVRTASRRSTCWAARSHRTMARCCTHSMRGSARLSNARGRSMPSVRAGRCAGAALGAAGRRHAATRRDRRSAGAARERERLPGSVRPSRRRVVWLDVTLAAHGHADGFHDGRCGGPLFLQLGIAESGCAARSARERRHDDARHARHVVLIIASPTFRNADDVADADSIGRCGFVVNRPCGRPAG